jgi:hypothetical protein
MKEYTDILNLTDTPIKPKGRDGLELKTGFLVVGVRKTEAEFSACYGGVQVPQEIIFEDAEGNVETTSPRTGTDK